MRNIEPKIIIRKFNFLSSAEILKMEIRPPKPNQFFGLSCGFILESLGIRDILHPDWFDCTVAYSKKMEPNKICKVLYLIVAPTEKTTLCVK